MCRHIHFDLVMSLFFDISLTGLLDCCITEVRAERKILSLNNQILTPELTPSGNLMKKTSMSCWEGKAMWQSSHVANDILQNCALNKGCSLKKSQMNVDVAIFIDDDRMDEWRPVVWQWVHTTEFLDMRIGIQEQQPELTV